MRPGGGCGGRIRTLGWAPTHTGLLSMIGETRLRALAKPADTNDPGAVTVVI
jgi:hypothetical protein